MTRYTVRLWLNDTRCIYSHSQTNGIVVIWQFRPQPSRRQFFRQVSVKLIQQLLFVLQVLIRMRRRNAPGQGAATEYRSSVRQIAREAGVSASTVSRVLSERPDGPKPSEEARRKVLEVCERLRFLPSVHYTRLIEGRSRIVGLMFDAKAGTALYPIFDENFGCFIATFERTLNQHGYSVLLHGVDERFEADKKYLALFRNGTVDGMVLWDTCRTPSTVEDLTRESPAVLAVAFPVDGVPNQIVPDNFKGGYDMTAHLLSLGHRRIAYISGDAGTVDHIRELGYRRAMKEAGLGVQLFEGQYTFESGVQWADHILTDHPQVTAIFAANDLVAAGCLRAALQRGRCVPGDIAIAGFDGTHHSAICTPPITTARLPLAQIGQTAAERLIGIIEGPGLPPEHLTLPIELIIRSSTAGS